MKKKYKKSKEYKKKKPIQSNYKNEHNTHRPENNGFVLQKTIGNQAVRHLFENAQIQAKLYIGNHRDTYEQEADKIADHVVTIINPKNTPPLAKKVIQRKESSEKTISTSLESQINSIKRMGTPLTKKTRDYFEPRFGIDLGNVRIHTNQNADILARAINARAFTLGNDIVFAGNEYKPDTQKGKKLIAHELSHVIQQQGNISKIQRLPNDDIGQGAQDFSNLDSLLKYLDEQFGETGRYSYSGKSKISIETIKTEYVEKFNWLRNQEIIKNNWLNKKPEWFTYNDDMWIMFGNAEGVFYVLDINQDYCNCDGHQDRESPRDLFNRKKSDGIYWLDAFIYASLVIIHPTDSSYILRQLERLKDFVHFIKPAEGAIGVHFGPYPHEIHCENGTIIEAGTPHDGIDIGNSLKTPIYAAAGGKVIKAKDMGTGYGKAVFIDHHNSYTTRYAHLNEILVEEGDSVTQGEQIGKMGKTGGLVNGIHLHFEIRLNGVPIDLEPLLS